MFFDNNQDDLLVVFPGFSKDSPRKYNYLLSLSRTKKFDILFVNDNFGYMGSYNLFEDGGNYPEIATCGLLDLIMNNGQYERLTFVGSSKGGTCALYYGLKYQVDEIIAGACQFYIGDYVTKETDSNVYFRMMGRSVDNEGISCLNSVMENCISGFIGRLPHILILCSLQDSTYKNHIVPLMNCLHSNHISFEFVEAFYQRHSEVGHDFKKLLNERLLLNY